MLQLSIMRPSHCALAHGPCLQFRLSLAWAKLNSKQAEQQTPTNSRLQAHTIFVSAKILQKVNPDKPIGATDQAPSWLGSLLVNLCKVLTSVRNDTL